MKAKRIRPSRGWKRPTASQMLTWAACFLLAAAAVTLVSAWPLSHSSKTGMEGAKTAKVNGGWRRSVPAEPTAVSTAGSERYYVIRGGIHSKAGLVKVLASDPVVAKHYANFKLAKFHFVRLQHGREAYVSYRIGDMIFWTNHKIPLYAGEMLATDGTHFARARCGNRVSAVPRKPTSDFQPSNLALGAPDIHLTPAHAKIPPLTGFLAPGSMPPLDGGGGSGEGLRR